MSIKYKFRDQNQLYFVTFAVINWIDLFIRNEYRQIMLDSWKFCRTNKGLELYAYVIMPSHVHMIIGSNKDELENIMRDMKKHTSGSLREAIKSHPAESRREWILWMMKRAGRKNSNNIEFQLWQQDSHPIELNNTKQLSDTLDYIHNNPIVAGFVEKAEDFLYSSARNYYDKKGLIDVIRIDPVVQIL